jgi:integrase
MALQASIENHGAFALELRDLLKRMWDYAVVCEVVASNPLQALQRKFIGKSVSRRRFLSAAEVGRFTLRKHLRNALQLILLTLTRKTEMLTAQWKEFDLRRGEWTIPGCHTKNKQPHVVYLSPQACRLLMDIASEFPDGKPAPSFYVIHAPLSKTQPISQSTLNRALGRVSKGFEYFRVHDLRRTAATLLSEDEYQADVIEKALNHTIKGVRGVYNRAQLKQQRKRMLADWADKVEDYAIEQRSKCQQLSM